MKTAHTTHSPTGRALTTCTAWVARLRPRGATRRQSRAACEARRKLTQRVDAVLQVAQQIFGGFDADRQAQQSVDKARGRARLGRHRRMSYRGRMRHEAFDAAQRFRQREQLERLGEALGSVGSALHFERDNGAEPGLLTVGNVVAWMRGKTWEVESLDGFLSGQELGHRLRVLSVLAQPHSERAKPAQGEVTVKRRAREAEAVAPRGH